jgi:FkbM family methyltransferase
VLLAPRTARRRARFADRGDPFGIAMLETAHYSQPMLDFMAASATNPDLLIEADLDETSVVVDAGAFVGEWSMRIAERYDPVIHAYEPNPQVLAHLREVLAGHERAHVHPYGLGDRDQNARLSLRGPGASIYGDRHAEGDTPSIGVEIRDVVAEFEGLGVEHIDLLKVNIEGGEYDLFDRLDAGGWLPRIDVVSVQFHEWHPDAYRRRRRIRRRLRATHRQAWCYPWVWELWRRVDA